MAIITPVETPPGAWHRLRLASLAQLEPIRQFRVQTADDVRAAVEVARKAQPAWSALSLPDKSGNYKNLGVEGF